MKTLLPQIIETHILPQNCAATPPKKACGCKGFYLTEAQVQHRIALELAKNGLDPILEVPDGTGNRLDIASACKSKCWGIELKYKTSSKHGGRFINQGLIKIAPYDFLEDIARLENWKNSGWIDAGCAVFITNESLHWTALRGAVKPAPLRLVNGLVISGRHTHPKGRAINISGAYTLKWHPAAPVGAHNFRALFIWV